MRGVGGGGIVSTAYCILYKLYTLKLTRKQVVGLLNHRDSPFIRGLGFMYIRYTQAPQDLWDWYEDYLDDEEEIDVKAGGGYAMTIGNMLKQWLTRLEWFETLFPRIPVPIQHEISQKMNERYGNGYEKGDFAESNGARSEYTDLDANNDNDERKLQAAAAATTAPARHTSPSTRTAKHRSRSRSRHRSHSNERDRRHRKHHKHHKSDSSKSHKRKSRSRSRERHRERRSRSSSRHNGDRKRRDSS